MAGEQLRVTEGKARGSAVEVKDELHIGRAPTEADGRLGDDPLLSRRHARVSRGADGQLTIEDLGSANGTFVNGERVSEAQPLNVGDSVRVGRTTLEVVDSGQATAQAAPVTPTAAPSAAPEPRTPAHEAPQSQRPPTGRPPPGWPPSASAPVATTWSGSSAASRWSPARSASTTCAHGYIDDFMSFADANGISYLGWAWDAVAPGAWQCDTGPALITNYDGTPTAYGVGLRAR